MKIGVIMLELILVDGKKVYVPQEKVYQISEGTEGTLVAGVNNGQSAVGWHNITSFSLLREGQKVSR
jgi:hypothetical protein